MTHYLPGRIDRKGLVPLCQINGIEQTNLVQPDNVAEIPTDQHVHLGDSGQRDVQHVVVEARAQDAVCRVAFDEGQSLIRNLHNLRW